MIYLDYVATTPLSDDIKKTYMYLLDHYFANSDSAYSLGYKVNNLQEEARSKIASMLKVEPQELIFTSCATEANNTAIKGVCFKYQNRGKHIITTSIEHSSVYNTFKELEDVFGFDVDYLQVNEEGKISLDELESLIRDDTILVSTMYINNEIGVINPIKEISRMIRNKNPKTKYHIDMVQALGKYPIDLSICDLATFSAHKIYGLKGSGLLYKNKKTSIVPLLNGGQQENNLRGGTSNALTNIVFAKTLRLALDSRVDHYNYVKELNMYLRENFKQRNIHINSPIDASIYILNFSLPHYKPEVVVHAFEEKDIYLSTKSACSSKSDISHTLSKMNIPIEISSSALRLSLSHLTTKDDVDTFLETLDNILITVKKQR